MKSVKVISVYAGPRRNMNNNLLTSDQCIDFLKLQIENDRTVDPGCPMDIILVNNDTGNSEANDFINSLDGQAIYNGIIRVFHRENKGGSFGAFSYAYDMISSEYDYFLFNEDDIMLFHPGYMTRSIEILMSRQDVGFIAFSPISFHQPLHCGGGFGVTSRSVLDRIISQYSQLPFVNENNYYAFEQSEIEFTNCIVRAGYSILNVPEYSPLAQNYEKHTSQMKPQYVTAENLNKTFIYKVGF